MAKELAGKKSPVTALSKAFIDSAAEMAEALGLEKSDAGGAMHEAKNQETTHASDQKLGGAKAEIGDEPGLDEHISEDREEQGESESEEEDEATGESGSGDEHDHEAPGEEDQDDTEEMPDKKVSAKMKKPIKKSVSLLDEMAEDEEVASAMDVEPFLRKLTKGISDRLDAMQESLAKSQPQDVKSLLKPMAKSIMSLGEMQGVIFDSIEILGSQPQKSASLIKSQHERFHGANVEAEGVKGNADMEKLEKSMDGNRALAIASHIFDGRTCAKIQGRLNKGLDLEPAWISAILKFAEKEDK
jgi:hypothetical protein